MKKLILGALLAAGLASSADATLLLFTVTGQYNGSFELDSDPVPTGSLAATPLSKQDSVYFENTVVSFPGQLQGSKYLTFYSYAAGFPYNSGGFSISDDQYDNSSDAINLAGPTLYTGDYRTPHFDSGEFDLFRLNVGTSSHLSITRVATVPEPASWLMMIAGFGMVGGAIRRTRRWAASFA